MRTTVTTINAGTYDDLRDKIPNSGVFEMTDCSVQIWCPAESTTEEIERMVNLVESMVHVVDVQVGSRIEDLTSEGYSVVITESKQDIRKKYPH